MAELIDQFHWLRPLWLLAMLPVVGLLTLIWRSHYASQQWHKHIAPSLLPALLEGGITKANGFVFTALAIIWSLGCVALAGPTWQKQPLPVIQNNDALVICWDLSPSMLAEDISPSRLARSRLKIVDLLNSRPDGQTALIAFSGEAYTVTPLTDDVQTIVNLLPALAPNTLPTLGSNPEMAFKQASDLLNQAGVLKGNIVMITDEIPSDALETLDELVANSAHKLTLWGIGTANGAPVPWGNQGFAKDSSGAIALAKLNEDELRAFAVKTNSYYVPVVNDNSDINALKSLISNAMPDDNTQSTDRLFDQWLEQGHWLVWACMALLVFGFRRGWLLCALVVLPQTLLPSNAHASPFKTDDQTGYEAYQQKNYEQAAKSFKAPDWSGAANYRSGNYDAAAKAFSKSDDAVSNFNQGNAQLLQGKFDEALKSYSKALEKDPELEPAKKNQQLAEALKKQKEQQQKQDGEKSDSDEKNDDQQQSEDQQKSDDQKSSEQSEQDKKDSEQQNQDSSDDDTQESQQQNGDQGSSSSSDNGWGKDGSSQSAASSADSMAQTTSSENNGENSSEMAMQQAMPAAEQPQTEEQQMLETMLRKVPDDPAGLLRAKFKKQYSDRQQQMRRGNNFNETKQAEQRW